MKTRLLLLLVLLASQPALRAQQWFRYTDFPVNITPKNISINNAGTLFMATKSNKIFSKPLNGAWKEVPGYLPDSSYWDTPSITAEKASNRLYTGSTFYPGGLFSTDDMGRTWNTFFLTTSPVSGLHESYNCFTEVKDPNLFFAGTTGGVIKLTNRGTTGQITTFGDPFTSSPEALHYTRNQKLLAGTFNDGIWISNNNAASFSQTPFSAGQVYRFTEDLNGRVYALSKNLVTNAINLIFSDNYTNWNIINLPSNTEEYTSLFFDSTTARLWLGSTNGLYQTATAAISWQNANLNNGAHSVIEVIGDQNGLYDFSYEKIAQKRNSAATAWEEIKEGLKGDIDAMFFGAGNKLFSYKYLYSEQMASVAPPPVIPSSLQSWQLTQVGANGFGIMYACNDKQRPDLIYCYTNQNKLYRSENNGTTYTQANIPAAINGPSRIPYLFVPGEQSGLFIAARYAFDTELDNELFGSFDKGQTWSQVGNFSGAAVEAVSQDATGRLFTLVTIDTTLVTHLYTSTDTGRNWSIVLEDVLPFNRKNLVSAGNRTFLYSDWELFEINPANSTPNTLINLPWPPHTSGREILAFKATPAALFIFNDGLHRSTDNGTNWQNLGKPDIALDDFLGTSSLQIAFDSIPFILPWPVAPKDRGIYYFRSTPLLSIRNISKEHNLVIFPNPASSTLQVKTDYRGGISLINVLGQQLDQYNIRKEETEINVAHLAAGVYFLRLEKTGQSVRIVKR